MDLSKSNIEKILIEIQQAKDGAVKMIDLMKSDPSLKERINNSSTKDTLKNSDYGLLLMYCSKAEEKVKNMKESKALAKTPEDFLNSFNAYDDGGLELVLIRETKSLLSLMDELKKLQS